ncbi:beta-hexosaminidase subunit alpha-like [Eriocheir sinensis]|uniref:beta-hexosaminidase subunit alpha-like n=1 Tax=Eriocheir sinensis TaxID=95602 RepID=UPI0021C6425B|nr:beta-hexosaminidase subunit alpha-like [Eriocheir sinensis]
MHPALLMVVVAVAGGAWAGIPKVTPTVGEVWPRPQSVVSQETYVIVRPETFSFTVVGHTCEILTEALQRYMNIMFPSTTSKRTQHPWTKDGNFSAYLDVLNVNLLAACEEQPYQGMDEQYEIKIDSPDAPGEGSLIAMSVWGILRGLETFSQLLVPNSGAYNVKSTQIRDFPRFSFRGLMLDTSRHYLPLTKIQQTLDLMAMNKFNVFHWHIVDDPSFPYVSSAYPNLSEQGAFSSSHIYTEGNISNIVQYGKMRGIRVLPEFDTPGHTQSWGSQPGLLTTCYKDSTPDGTFGPIDPSNNANYDFLKNLFTEVTSRFPDHYIHLGGDEVSFDCWKSNPNITEFMAQQNITGDYAKLEEIYITKLIDIVSNLPTKNGYLVWQEVFDNGVEIAEDTLVHIWKNGNAPLIFKEELKKVTEAGYNTILSSCWYLNYISYGVDWYKYYECDPQDFDGTDAQKQLVVGGEACMWGEYVDRTNLIPRTWPRASVVAEKLWSSKDHTNDTSSASPRLEEHRCRLLDRGYDAEPIWPSFCASDVSDPA